MTCEQADWTSRRRIRSPCGCRRETTQARARGFASVPGPRRADQCLRCMATRSSTCCTCAGTERSGAREHIMHARCAVLHPPGHASAATSPESAGSAPSLPSCCHPQAHLFVAQPLVAVVHDEVHLDGRGGARVEQVEHLGLGQVEGLHVVVRCWRTTPLRVRWPAVPAAACAAALRPPYLERVAKGLQLSLAPHARRVVEQVMVRLQNSRKSGALVLLPAPTARTSCATRSRRTRRSLGSARAPGSVWAPAPRS